MFSPKQSSQTQNSDGFETAGGGGASKKLFSNAFVRNISASSMFQYFSGNQMSNGSNTDRSSNSQMFNSSSNIFNQQVNPKNGVKQNNMINNLNNNIQLHFLYNANPKHFQEYINLCMVKTLNETYTGDFYNKVFV